MAVPAGTRRSKPRNHRDPTSADGRRRAAAGAAPVYGATYIPGVGFRYVAPGGLRVYGWTCAYGPRVYGYRPGIAVVYRDERCFWLCGRLQVAPALIGLSASAASQPASLTTEMSGASSFFMPCTW